MVNSAQVQPVVIFLHLPKTAGSTLARIIERQFDSASILHLYQSDFGEELAAIPPSQIDRLRVIMGHFYFGAHEFFSKPSTYITLLRDPIERTISHYYYARQAPSHYFHDAARRLSLKEFVEYCSRMSNKSGTALGYCSDNDQTRQIAGKYGVPSYGTSSETLLSIAQRNLAEYCAVAGITEEFDRSLILMKHIFGWHIPFYLRQNVTPERPRRAQLPQETIRVIQAYNELDLELYDYAKELFEVQIRSQGRSFEKQLQRFRICNSAYGRLRLLLSIPKRAVAAKLSGTAHRFMSHE